MDVQVVPTELEAADVVAQKLADAIRKKPKLVLGLPTGRTPLPVYRKLVELHGRAELDLSKATTFNLDEFAGLNGQDAASFRAYMDRHLFKPIGMPPANIQFLDGRAPDLEAECQRYEGALAARGGLDLVFLGLGTNGHLAFNEPADVLIAETHVARLTRETRLANLEWFGDRPDEVPTQALTLGMRAILQARRVILLATGSSKKDAVRRLREGEVTPRLPASFLKLHANVELVLDQAAAG